MFGRPLEFVQAWLPTALVALTMAAASLALDGRTPRQEVLENVAVARDEPFGCRERDRATRALLPGRVPLTLPIQDLVITSSRALRIPACSPGLLRIEMYGTLVDGRGAHVVVSWRHVVLWEGQVLDPVALEIKVPADGWLTLMFTNDRVLPPEDRNLVIRHLSLISTVDMGSEPF